jgi:hypothetical protein
VTAASRPPAKDGIRAHQGDAPVDKRRLVGVADVTEGFNRPLVVERVSKSPRLEQAQSRLLDPRAMVDVEGGSDLVRVHASLRPDERTDQRMSKRNPVDHSVLVPRMGGTCPSSRFFPGDLQLDDRDHMAPQDRPVDADPRDLYRLVVARLEPKFLVEASDGEAIDVLGRPRPIRRGGCRSGRGRFSA